MDKHEEIIRLLTEIRDNQREDIALRREILNNQREKTVSPEAVEQSLRMQREAVRWQRIGIAIMGIILAGLALFLVYAKEKGWLGR